MEELNTKHDQLGLQRQNVDPERLIDHIKKMSVSLDLTNQRCQNYQRKIKDLEGNMVCSTFFGRAAFNNLIWCVILSLVELI